MWCLSIRKLSQLPSCSFSVAGSLVCPVNAVRDLGIFIDNDLGAATNVWGTMSCCFAVLRQLCHLHEYVIDDCFHSLMVLLVHSGLDYDNFILLKLPAYLQQHLQSILNATAHLAFRLGCYDHVSDAPATLHWLRLPQRVDFKLAVMSFLVLHGFVPPDLNDLVRVTDLSTSLVIIISTACSNHSGSQPSVHAHFQSLHRSSGTRCYLTSNHPCLPPTFKNIPFFTILQQHSSVTLLHLYGLHNSSAILATLKFFD